MGVMFEIVSTHIYVLVNNNELCVLSLINLQNFALLHFHYLPEEHVVGKLKRLYSLVCLCFDTINTSALLTLYTDFTRINIVEKRKET